MIVKTATFPIAAPSNCFPFIVKRDAGALERSVFVTD